ncbi:MAG: S4 domain-containing protein [Gemmataceae bacterium]
MERLNKYLAHAGVGSRRHCDDLIFHGRVSVDGEKVREPGARIDPSAQQVAVDGQPVQAEPLVYWLLNKPRRLPLRQPRPAEPAPRPRPDRARPPASLHRRPPRRGQRGAAADDQRRRPGL